MSLRPLISLRLLVGFAVDYFVLTFATALKKHCSGREPARRAEGIGRIADNGSGFAHAVGVRALWKTAWDSVYARRPDGLPTFATVTDSDNRFNITKNHRT